MWRLPPTFVAANMINAQLEGRRITLVKNKYNAAYIAEVISEYNRLAKTILGVDQMLILNKPRSVGVTTIQASGTFVTTKDKGQVTYKWEPSLGPVSWGGVVSLIEKHQFDLDQQIKWWHKESIAAATHRLYYGDRDGLRPNM